MPNIEFIKDFATRKKGDILEFDNQLCSQLVHTDKVAKYTDKPIKFTEYTGPRDSVNEVVETETAKPVIQEENV